MIETLLKLGLSEKEAKVYLAALTLGSAPAAKIAEKSGVNRPTTYLILNKLSDMKLVTFYDKGKIQHFTAEDPVRLGGLIQEQEREVQQKSTEFRGRLPEFQALYQQPDQMRAITISSLSEAWDYLRRKPTGSLIVLAPDESSITATLKKEFSVLFHRVNQGVVMCSSSAGVVITYDPEMKSGVILENRNVAIALASQLEKRS